MAHARGKPYHPQTQDKIECWLRALFIKELDPVENCYFPSELENRIRQFVAYYNHQRYYESLTG